MSDNQASNDLFSNSFKPVEYTNFPQPIEPPKPQQQPANNNKKTKGQKTKGQTKNKTEDAATKQKPAEKIPSAEKLYEQRRLKELEEEQRLAAQQAPEETRKVEEEKADSDSDSDSDDSESDSESESEESDSDAESETEADTTVATDSKRARTETPTTDDKEDENEKATKKRKVDDGSAVTTKKTSDETTDVKDGEDDDELLQDDPEKIARTIFVGNAPVDPKKKKLRQAFSKYGKIVSIRLRNIVFEDLKLSKKVKYIKKQFSQNHKTCNAYIVFTTKEQANAALAANGTLVGDHHIRVDLAGNANPKFDHKKTIFVGNLAFETTEDELRKTFTKHVGTVVNVRIVRDKETNIGKGIGFVEFKNRDLMDTAVSNDGKFMIRDRRLRVKRASRMDRVGGKKAAKVAAETAASSKKPWQGATASVPAGGKQKVKGKPTHNAAIRLARKQRKQGAGAKNTKPSKK